MVSTKFNRPMDINQNSLAWPVFEEYGQFTPAQRVETIVSAAGQDLWLRMLSRFNATPNGREETVDEAILAGRVKNFSCMSDLIADLDKPE